MLDSESVMLNKKRAIFALSTGNIVPQGKNYLCSSRCIIYWDSHVSILFLEYPSWQLHLAFVLYMYQCCTIFLSAICHLPLPPYSTCNTYFCSLWASVYSLCLVPQCSLALWPSTQLLRTIFRLLLCYLLINYLILLCHFSVISLLFLHYFSSISLLLLC